MRLDKVVTTTVTGGLALWLLLTATNQLPDRRFDNILQPGKRKIKTPNWRFFGPNPGTKDSHLLYRDVIEEKPGQWQEVPIAAQRPFYAIVWNASNRCPKALFDSLQGVTMAAYAVPDDMEFTSRTPSYRFLAEYVTTRLPHAENASSTQFILLESYLRSFGDREIEPLFTSERLPLR